jgi:peptide/nickel transport system permease protein
VASPAPSAIVADEGGAAGAPRPAFLSQAPWMALYPGLMIFFIVMALNVLGDGLRDALDPRT